MLTDHFKQGLSQNNILSANLGWLARCGISHRGRDEDRYYFFKNNWKMRIEFGTLATFSNSTHLITVAAFFDTIIQYQPIYKETPLDDPGLYRVLKLLRDNGENRYADRSL